MLTTATDMRNASKNWRMTKARRAVEQASANGRHLAADLGVVVVGRVRCRRPSMGRIGYAPSPPAMPSTTRRPVPLKVTARGGSRSDNVMIRAIAALHRADAERHVGAELACRTLSRTSCAPGMIAAKVAGSSSICPDCAPAQAAISASPLPYRARPSFGSGLCAIRAGGGPSAAMQCAPRASPASAAGSISAEPERIRDRVGDAHRRAHAIALADALGAERRERRRRTRNAGSAAPALPSWSAPDSRQSVPEMKLPSVGIDEFLVERGAERMRKPAGHLARHHAGMQHAAAVVHGDVFVDAHRAGDAIDLDAAEIEDEAVAERGVDVVRLRSARSVAAASRTRSRGAPGRHPAACPAPNGRRGDARRTAARCRDCRVARDAAGRELDLLRPRTLSCAAAARASLSLMRSAGKLHRAADRRREAARIIAGRDRPGIARGVHVGDDADVGRLQPERIGDDLRHHRAMALALRDRRDMHRHRAAADRAQSSRSPARHSSARPCAAPPA